MKSEIRLAFLCLSAATVPALAQDALPRCGSTNFDRALSAYTILNPAAGPANQQCLITVYPTGAMPRQARQDPASYLVEGSYVIELVGGGGGGGGGGTNVEGGGGGGAGAAPLRTVQYLPPGEYKLTIGTGGEGGAAYGGQAGEGNPTSLTNANTGQLIAGFAGADTWRQHYQSAGGGRGGVAAAGGSRGGSGGDSGPMAEEAAQRGGRSQTPGFSGTPGQAGSEVGRSAEATAGGGGGASIGSGATGGTAHRGMPAQAGGRGGAGLIRLTMAEPAPQAVAPAPLAVTPARVPTKYSLSTDTLFGFGKAALAPAGEAKLDELRSKLTGVNIDAITITGHADRIGSQELNQRLSESRAESVKAYLMSKGIQSDRISMMGKGETQPVISPDACKGPVTSKVIACLQPDRRVEIEVVGRAE